MKLRRVYPLVIVFVFVPAALMLTVGILILGSLVTLLIIVRMSRLRMPAGLTPEKNGY